MERPTTLSRPTTLVNPTSEDSRAVAWAKAYKGIQQGPMAVYQCEDGRYEATLWDEWLANPSGTVVACVRKIDCGCRIAANYNKLW